MAHQETDQGTDQRPAHQPDEDRFRVIRSAARRTSIRPNPANTSRR